MKDRSHLLEHDCTSSDGFMVSPSPGADIQLQAPGSLPSSTRVVPDPHGLQPRGAGKGKKPPSSLSASLLLWGVGSSEGLLQVSSHIKDLHS